MTNLFVLLLIATFAIWMTEGSRILISVPFGTKSHKNMYISLVQELVARKHQVTVITNYPTPDFLGLDNVHEIVLDNLIVDMSDRPNVFNDLLSPDNKWGMTGMLIHSLLEMPHRITDVLYSDLRIKKMIANDTFDLVIATQVTLASVPLAWHFKAPLITFSPNMIMPGVATSLGDQEHTSYVPFVFTHYTDKMDLWQRTMNTLITRIYQLYSQFINQFTILPIVRKHGLPDCPPLEDIAKNVTVVFTNTHPSFTYPRSLPPQVVEIGGIHCRPAKPLPSNLERFVSVADGFIVFGVGSLQKIEDMPEHLVQSFIRVFANLPQRVIWQWKGKFRSDLPKNILAVPWLPQQDLLGHSKCRAFITHGGLNSLQEAIYHAVPVLGLPFGIDHHLNLARAVNDGYAIKLEWKDVNENTLSAAIRQLLHNSKYTHAARRVSNLFHDQMQTPLERAVYWTEYVMRNNGTDHLRLESRNLAPYQRDLMDVYFLLLLAFLTPFVFIYITLRYCRRPRAKGVTVGKKQQ